ncbi:hypothetical protein F5148DRAFT_1147349 [Russula earlei]|uniref:Uncharacterized protein n=1 Tax=Russula earlei TaxID=71964 RepID=A0ACC0UG88_9AGAM|nr:hypothetical protein F5148DRAFT_1147349 [Russula earlei]
MARTVGERGRGNRVRPVMVLEGNHGRSLPNTKEPVSRRCGGGHRVIVPGVVCRERERLLGGVARPNIIPASLGPPFRDLSDDVKSLSLAPEGGKRGKSNTRGNHHGRGRSPARELVSGTHEAGHEELPQPRKGSQETHNHCQRQQQRSTPSGSGAVESKPGRGGGCGFGHVHASQKRRAATTNGNAEEGGGHAAERYKGERPQPPKRGSPGPSAVQSHPDFWHSDGSVVVEIGRTRFKLHLSTLQKHSAYFAAAFRETGSRRRDERSQHGRLPVYRVAETTADDFAALLTVIEEPMCEVRGRDAADARALLHDAQSAGPRQRECLGRVWNRLGREGVERCGPHALKDALGPFTLRVKGERARGASCELLRLPTFGQTIAVSVPAAERNDGTRDAHADLIRLLHAREQLGLVWAEVASKAPTDFACHRSAQQTQIRPEERTGGGSGGGGGGCASANVDRVHARWAELVHATGLYVQRMIDPLMGLQDLMEIPWKDEGFCKKCVSARKKAWDELRRKACGWGWPFRRCG